jgi:hypothetical protein
MSRMIVGLIGLALMLTWLAPPAGALAAPAVTVSPASGPRGTAVGVSASGLMPDTSHLVQLVRGVGNINTVRLFEETATSTAGGDLHYRLLVDQEPGAYTVRIVAIGGTVLATAPFIVTPGLSIPTITLTPDRGPCTTRPLLSGRGFPPGAAVAIYQQRLDANNAPVGAARPVATARAGPDGRLAPVAIATLAQDCSDTPPATPDGSRILLTAVPPGASPDATTEPERRAVFTVERGAAESRHFPETGHTVQGRFLAYWRAHGLDLGDPDVSERESIALFGYPISGEFMQTLVDGQTRAVQYFERARFEHHPENAAPYDVLLGQFGRQIVADLPDAPTAPVAPRAGARHFPETGHNVGPPFALFWSRNGGLAIFGYPISEPFTQTLEDGRQRTVQYFERARFEQHPAGEGTPYNIQLGLFGRQILDRTGGAGAAR